MKKIPLILDGRAVRDEIRARLKREFAAGAPLVRRGSGTLAIVQVGSDPASSAYIRQKMLFGESVGARVLYRQFPHDIPETKLLAEIKELNRDARASGIIVQLPLPPHLDKQKVRNAVARAKDVDGLAEGSPFTPATARGVLELLTYYGISVTQKNIAVFGRSLIAGGPIARLLAVQGAKVMVIHSQTPMEEAKRISRASDIIVVAIGKPKYIGAEYFRGDQTQVVVDVGINRVTTGEALAEEVPPLYKTRGKHLVGDVDFDTVRDCVAAISPVPGGVGPMTVAALFENLKDARVKA